MNEAIAQSPGWDGTLLPMTECNRFECADVEGVRDHMSQMFTPHRLELHGARSEVAFRHDHFRLRAMSFHAVAYNMPSGQIEVFAPPPEDAVFVQFSLSGIARIGERGRTYELAPGSLTVLDPSRPVREMFNGDYFHFMVKMSHAELCAVLIEELGYPVRGLEFSSAPVPLTGAAAAFAHLIRSVTDDVDRGAGIYKHARMSHSVEDMLNRLLLMAVPHNYSELFDAPSFGPTPYYVRRVEEFVHAHAPEPISLSDMIEVSKVSARSLHTGFRRFRNATPMQYLKNHRLDLAHHQLRTAVDEERTVTDVALACGFSHLSKFARDYRERFGKLPSQTLRGI